MSPMPRWFVCVGGCYGWKSLSSFRIQAANPLERFREDRVAHQGFRGGRA